MKYAFTLLALLLTLTAYSQPNGKHVLMEHITSTGCPGCAWGNYVRDSILQFQPNALFVSVHRNDAVHPDSMGCADADSVLSEYLWAHPTSAVDRVLWDDFPRITVTTNQWSEKIDRRNQASVISSIGGVTTYDSLTRTLSVTVNGVIQWNLEQDIRVNAYIMEDSVTGNGLGWDQLNGNNNSPTSPLFGLGDPITNYMHRYVLRDMLAGHHGLSGVIANPVTSGTPFSHTFTTTLDSRWNDKQVYVIVLVQKHDPSIDNRQIYNCARIDLNQSVLAGDADMAALSNPLRTFELFPNPVSDRVTLRVPSMDEWDIEMLDLSGHVLKQHRLVGDEVDLSTAELAAGCYLLRIRNDKQPTRTMRFIVR